MKKKYPVRVELKALLEMFAQNRFAMWKEIDNESPNECDRCALKVCPAYVDEEEKIVNEIIHLLTDYTVNALIDYADRLKRAEEAAKDFKDEPITE
jgi:hypothetical protein